MNSFLYEEEPTLIEETLQLLNKDISLFDYLYNHYTKEYYLWKWMSSVFTEYKKEQQNYQRKNDINQIQNKKTTFAKLYSQFQLFQSFFKENILNSLKLTPPSPSSFIPSWIPQFQKNDNNPIYSLYYQYLPLLKSNLNIINNTGTTPNATTLEKIKVKELHSTFSSGKNLKKISHSISLPNLYSSKEKEKLESNRRTQGKGENIRNYGRSDQEIWDHDGQNQDLLDQLLMKRKIKDDNKEVKEKGNEREKGKIIRKQRITNKEIKKENTRNSSHYLENSTTITTSIPSSHRNQNLLTQYTLQKIKIIK
ncbi:hypothetical protein U3516DRAFT_670501 [Neocallimastix sp. 'constans']